MCAGVDGQRSTASENQRAAVLDGQVRGSSSAKLSEGPGAEDRVCALHEDSGSVCTRNGGDNALTDGDGTAVVHFEGGIAAVTDVEKRLDGKGTMVDVDVAA